MSVGVLGVSPMGCVSKQLTLDGSLVDCEICEGCIRVRADLEVERRRYWFNRNRKRRNYASSQIK